MNVKENEINGLCCSCGICKSVCRKGAIKYTRKKGMFVPQINQSQCNDCGLCAYICPGFCQDYQQSNQDVPLLIAAEGEYIECYNAWSNYPEIRHNSASGGVVTTLIKTLLTNDQYDLAFCVDTYSYNDQVYTVPYSKKGFLEQIKTGFKTPKSRYIPVSHEKTVDYLLNNRDKRIIIVATPCALHGICKVIERFKLNRDQYLLIGLFCQKSFQYNIYDYFCAIAESKDHHLDSLHFKNKESGGWPGNVKLFYTDNSFEYLNSSYRTNAKDYFQPERCLYCIDKLSVKGDISLGDNYTGLDDSPLGSNSVIIRTSRGMEAWSSTKDNIIQKRIDFSKISDAQALQDRVYQNSFAQYKKQQLQGDKLYVPLINSGIIPANEDIFSKQLYADQLKKVKVGSMYIAGSKTYDTALKNESKESTIRRLKQRIKMPLSVLKRKIIHELIW